MWRFSSFLSSMVLLAVLIFVISHGQQTTIRPEHSVQLNSPTGQAQIPDGPVQIPAVPQSGSDPPAHRTGPPLPAERPRSGPDQMRWFMAKWHEPYGAVLPADQLRSVWDEIKALPTERSKAPIPEWELVGPSGMQTGGVALWSGRVLDIDALSSGGTKVAAASGGLWGYNAIFPSPRSDDLPTLWAGTFAVDPSDPDTILLGTGEFWIYRGMGLFKTIDGGANWEPKPVNAGPFGQPAAFSRIRYSTNGQVVHAATQSGYYRSTDNGETWQLTFSGEVTDLALSSAGSDLLWMTVVDQGLYRTWDAGLSWEKIAGTGIPTSDVTRGAVTSCDADPNVVYVAFAHDHATAGSSLKGIYKTTNFGATWTKLPLDNYMGKQGWYNNVIAVAPNDCDRVLAGGVTLWRSQSGGASWLEITDPHLHNDYHAIQWHADGEQVWVGHDGGWSYSNNHAWAGSWTSDANYLPITQLYYLDVWANEDKAFVGGGTQDNGWPLTHDSGVTWFFAGGGDGGGFKIHPLDRNFMYAASGYIPDGLDFHRYGSVDAGITWNDMSSGLDNSSTWEPVMQMDGGGRLYTNNGRHVYSTRDAMPLSWTKENAQPFLENVLQVAVSPVPGQPTIYACLDSKLGKRRLMVGRFGVWAEVSNGLPNDVAVRKVVPHPTDPARCYALMDGFGAAGERIYESDAWGFNWTNITGDLPRLPLGDLILRPNDFNALYLGTEFGFYRSLNGGANWYRWNDGIPDAVMVTEMKLVDRGEMGEPRYTIYAATFGRSVWKRDLLDDYFTATDQVVPGRPGLRIHSAVPNPFNPSTTVAFELERAAAVRVDVFDLRGRKVRALRSTKLAPGIHEVRWNGLDDDGGTLASGVYLVTVEADGAYASQKVTLTK